MISLCPTCGEEMISYTTTNGSCSKTIVEYGDFCQSCHTKTYWRYGENYYYLRGQLVTKDEWVAQWLITNGEHANGRKPC